MVRDISGTLASKRLVAPLVALFLLAVSAVAVFFSVRTDSMVLEGDWPPLTMVYAMDGPVWNGVTIAETHRLEYRSTLDWTDTVIESDSIESLALGTVTTVGSYSRLNGTRYEKYDSTIDTLEVVETEGGIRFPNRFLVSSRSSDFVEPQDRNLVRVLTGSSVCYQGECEPNANGFAHCTRNQGWVYADDSRWDIPLTVGESFMALEVDIDSTKEKIGIQPICSEGASCIIPDC